MEEVWSSSLQKKQGLQHRHRKMMDNLDEQNVGGNLLEIEAKALGGGGCVACWYTMGFRTFK